mmetsp:Transcript_37055/g.80979  ORF Transcript_37055/g.80979 Transcript_37055/m.80979 type:complete len:145 (-) Transcript_37055:8-442(-)
MGGTHSCCVSSPTVAYDEVVDATLQGQQQDFFAEGPQQASAGVVDHRPGKRVVLPISLTLRKSPGDKFGFTNVSRADGIPGLTITRITPGNLLAQYNANVPERRQVLPGAIVTSVNNCRDDTEKMREFLVNCDEVQLEVQNVAQ